MPTVWASRTIPWDGTRDEFCYWLRWGSRSVWKKTLSLLFGQGNRRKTVTEILVNVDKPRSKTQTQMHFLRWVNLLRKHHSERSDFSNLTNENPRPSTFLKQDSNNNLQSRYLSYSRHSCCSGSLELHLHVTGVKDYICIHVKNIHIQEPACYGMTFKLRTDPRGTITTFCANTKPKYPSRRCEKQQQKHKLRLTEHLISVNKGNRIHFYSQSYLITIGL